MRVGWHKAFFVLAAVILAGSMRWSLAPGKPAGRVPGQLEVVGGEPYTERTPPAVELREASWAAPLPQSDDGLWLYDLFTPPRIYRDPQTGWFSVEPPTADAAPAASDLELAGLERELYRLQYEGYIEEDRSGAGRWLIRVHDRERDRAVLVRVGEVHAAGRFEVLDFAVERRMSPDGLMDRREVVTIRDLETGGTETLRSGEWSYTGSVLVTLRGEAETGVLFRWPDQSEPFLWKGESFRLMQVDLESHRVRLEKVAADKRAAEILTLSLSPGRTVSPAVDTADDFPRTGILEDAPFRPLHADGY